MTTDSIAGSPMTLSGIANHASTNQRRVELQFHVHVLLPYRARIILDATPTRHAPSVLRSTLAPDGGFEQTNRRYAHSTPTPRARSTSDAPVLGALRRTPNYQTENKQCYDEQILESSAMALVVVAIADRRRRRCRFRSSRTAYDTARV